MSEQVSQRWYLRPLTAVALLAIEYLAVSLSFDAIPLVETGGAFAGLGRMGLVGPAIIAFGTALWMLGGTEIREALSRDPGNGETLFWPRLVVHISCFVAFFSLTALLFERDHLPAGPVWLWTGLWLLAGIATAISLAPIALGKRRVLPLVRELAIRLALATLLALLALGAGLATAELWDRLAPVTLHAVAWVLDLLVSPIYFDPANVEIGTEEFWVHVAPVCSGYEGIGLILVFLSAYLVGFRKRLRFPNVLVLIPAAIVLMWLLNILRIVALILVGHFWSPEVAIGGFHSKAGWLVFCGVALGAVWLTQRVGWFASESSDPRRRTTNPSAPFLLPLLSVVATALITGLFIDDFDYFYPLRVVVALLALAWYRQDYVAGLRHQLRGRSIVSWHAVGTGIAVYVLWIGISALTAPYAAEAPPEALSELATPLVAVWIIGRMLGAVLVVPIVEELAFRGFLLRRLVASDFTKVPYDQWHWWPVLISSLAFAAAHQQWIGGFAAGVLYAYAQKRRGLLSDAIVAHAVTNALIAMQVLLAGHWSLW
jgi:exosortase E/protease (VPEID-CTERM system)